MAQNNSSRLWNNVRTEIDKKISQSESDISIRNSRQGYRNMGFYQLSRNNASEGVMVVGITRGGKVG
jgi:hypothetical protein